MSREFVELDLAEWDKFERSHADKHFFQGIQRLKKRQTMGYRNYIVGVKDDGRIVAGGVLLGRGGELWMAYGPLINWDDAKLVSFFLEQAINFAREKGFVKIEIFPRILLSTRDNKGDILKKWDRSKLLQKFADLGFKYQGETIDYQMKAGRWAFTKDLSEIFTVEELRATYRKTLRVRLRQTEGKIIVSALKRDQLGILVGLIDESDSRNGVSGRALKYYQQIYDAFGKDVEFLVAKKTDDETAVAGAIFIYHGTEVSSYLSGMDRRYRDLNGRAWLQDYVMINCLGKGIVRVNFFWVEGKFANNHLLEFKSGFGGVVEEYIGGFEKVLNPTKYYSRLVLRKGKSLLKKLAKIPSRFGH